MQVAISAFEIVYELLSCVGDPLDGTSIVRAKEDIAFVENVGISPFPTSDEGIAEWTGAFQVEGGRETKRWVRVSGDFAIDTTGRGVEISVTSGELIPGQHDFLLECLVIVEDAG
jgi:hypothetical protein